jgi:Putative Actinobacterial Holin-X, holin superfamily III
MNPAENLSTPTPPDDTAAPSPSLGDLAHGTSDYVRAWSALFAAETQLAGRSAVRLVLAALVIPALALGICITLDAFIAALLARWLHDWTLCIAITLILDLTALGLVLLAMRRWWRNLTLPRSRDALARMLQRLA